MLCRRPVGGGADERLTTDLEQRPVGELGDGDSAGLAILNHQRSDHTPAASNQRLSSNRRPG
jgi:hypothetical protein